MTGMCRKPPSGGRGPRRAPPVAALLCLLLASPSAPGAGALWRVDGADPPDYLAGSIHLLPAGEGLPECIAQAWTQTTALVLEVDPSALSDASVGAQMMAAAAAGAPGLRAQFGDGLADRVAAQARRFGLPAEFLEAFHPWFAALTLQLAAAGAAGMVPAHGIDLQLAARAAAEGRTLGALETVADQIEVFRSLDAANARAMLELTLDDLESDRDPAAKLLATWRSGDLQALDEELARMRRRSPALHAALIQARNRRWVGRIAQLARDDDAQLIVAGLAHFAGDDGLPALLAARGLRLTRVACDD